MSVTQRLSPKSARYYQTITSQQHKVIKVSELYKVYPYTVVAKVSVAFARVHNTTLPLLQKKKGFIIEVNSEYYLLILNPAYDSSNEECVLVRLYPKRKFSPTLEEVREQFKDLLKYWRVHGTIKRI